MDNASLKLQLRKEIKQHLDTKILPFWEELRDDIHGGFTGLVGFDLKRDPLAVRGCILNSRILWFFSNAYLAEKEPEQLDCARHAFEYLKTAFVDPEYGGVYWSVNADGTAAEDMKHTYNQAFAIYGLSSYYDASKDPEALKIAWDLFDVIEQHCRDGEGYLEAFNRNYSPCGNEKLSENGVMAERTMNTLLHVFEAYTELYRVSKDVRAAEKMRWICHLFAEKIYNPDRQRQEVFFDHDWNSLIDLHSYGHDIESSWLIDRGLKVLDDPEVTALMAPVTDALAEETHRAAFDGYSMMNECERGVVNKSRVWWVQAETEIGFMNYYEKHPEHKDYLSDCLSVWNFIKEYIVDPREGSEWFWEVDDSMNPNSQRAIVDPWKCPYHNGRMCLEMMRRLEA